MSNATEEITSVYAAVQSYDAYLDELDTVTIGSLEYSVSRVLRTVDPIAYRCGFADWLDTEGLGDAAEEWDDSHNWPA